MNKILEKLQNLEDDIVLLKEEVSMNKIKVVKLERKLKESNEKIECLESMKPTTYSEKMKPETGCMKKEITAIKKQCNDVNSKCERLTKLQHVLNSFILKSHDSNGWETGMKSLRSDVSRLSQTVSELQKALASSRKAEEVENPPQPAYFSSICREMTIVPESGILMYTSKSGRIPVGQFISLQPLTEKCPSFSFRILSPGQKCTIAIGVCPRGYPADRQPGWSSRSIAYHADDGGIFVADGYPLSNYDACTTGDVMKCKLSFSQRIVSFFKNGEKVVSIRHNPNDYGCNAAVGMHSPGEAVMLLEKEPWRK